MRLNVIAMIVGLSLVSSGCGIVKYSAFNMVVSPARVVNHCRNHNEE